MTRELDLGVGAGDVEQRGDPFGACRIVAVDSRAGVQDDDDAALHGATRARCQYAASALRQIASQATPSANAATTSLR